MLKLAFLYLLFWGFSLNIYLSSPSLITRQSPTTLSYLEQKKNSKLFHTQALKTHYHSTSFYEGFYLKRK